MTHVKHEGPILCSQEPAMGPYSKSQYLLMKLKLVGLFYVLFYYAISIVDSVALNGKMIIER
jgi:hypothetical protein